MCERVKVLYALQSDTELSWRIRKSFGFLSFFIIMSPTVPFFFWPPVRALFFFFLTRAISERQKPKKNKKKKKSGIGSRPSARVSSCALRRCSSLGRVFTHFGRGWPPGSVHCRSSGSGGVWDSRSAIPSRDARYFFFNRKKKRWPTTHTTNKL